MRGGLFEHDCGNVGHGLGVFYQGLWRMSFFGEFVGVGWCRGGGLRAVGRGEYRTS